MLQFDISTREDRLLKAFSDDLRQSRDRNILTFSFDIMLSLSMVDTLRYIPRESST